MSDLKGFSNRDKKLLSKFSVPVQKIIVKSGEAIWPNSKYEIASDIYKKTKNYNREQLIDDLITTHILYANQTTSIIEGSNSSIKMERSKSSSAGVFQGMLLGGVISPLIFKFFGSWGLLLYIFSLIPLYMYLDTKASKIK